MTASWFPRFLDVEASGFGPGSWPVAVAWSDAAGAIRSCLVQPDPAWTHWEAEAEAVHGLSRERLAAEGLPAVVVAGRLRDDLDRQLVFTDAPDFDAAWLDVLYALTGGVRPFRLDHADDLLVGALLRPGELLWQAQARLDRMKTDLRSTAAGRHDAGFDVGFLVALWRRCLGETVKHTHGAGPLPALTATGSFRRSSEA